MLKIALRVVIVWKFTPAEHEYTVLGRNMLLIYTGTGKGKTSASVGQAVRACGQGLRVAFAQFMKQPEKAGEQLVLARLLGEAFYAGGKGFFRCEDDRPRHRQAALDTLAWARRTLDSVDMLVLDEALYALAADLLRREELESLLYAARQRGSHVVLSGRGLPAWLREQADLVTEMQELKHPWRLGVPATRGIEF